MPDPVDELLRGARDATRDAKPGKPPAASSSDPVSSFLAGAERASKPPVLSGLRHLPRPPDPTTGFDRFMLGTMSGAQAAADRIVGVGTRLADLAARKLGLSPEPEDAQRFLAPEAADEFARRREAIVDRPVTTAADLLLGDEVGSTPALERAAAVSHPELASAAATGREAGSVAGDTLTMLASGAGIAKGAGALLAKSPAALRALAATRVGRFGVEAAAFGAGNILIDPNNPIAAAANGVIALTGMKGATALVRPLSNILGRWAGRLAATGEAGTNRVARVLERLAAGGESAMVGAAEGLGMSALPHVAPDLSGFHSSLAGALEGSGSDQLSVAVNTALMVVLKAAHPEISPARIEAYARGMLEAVPPGDRAALDATAGPLLDAARDARAATDVAVAGGDPISPASKEAAAAAGKGPGEADLFDPTLVPSAPVPGAPGATGAVGGPAVEAPLPTSDRRGAGRVTPDPGVAPRDLIEAEAARLLADSKERKRLEDGMRAEGLTPEVFEAGRAGATIPADALERSNASTWEDAVRKRAGDVAAMRWERGQLKAGETTPSSLLEGAAAPAAPPPPVESPAGKALIDFATADVEVPGARMSSTFGVGRALDTGPDPSPAGSALVDFAEAMAQGRSLREAARASATPPEAPLERPSQRVVTASREPEAPRASTNPPEQLVTTKAEAGSGAKARTPTESLRGWKVVDAKYQEDASGEWVTIASPSTQETKVVEGRFVPLLVESGVLRAPRVPEISLGRDVEIPVPGGSPVRARYVVIDRGDLRPSHDPNADFSPTEGYPTSNRLQERDYRTDVRERAKVEGMARDLNPAEVANTSPRATDGPPTVTPEGVVINGNGRSMALKSATPERLEAYRKHLVESATSFGIDPDAVRSAKDPVLVRVVEMDPSSPEAAEFGRRGNIAATQSVSPRERASRVAALIDDEILGAVASDPELTFSQAIVDPAKGKEFRRSLERGMAAEERKEFFNEDGSLTEAGKELARNAILAKTVGSDILEEIPAGLRRTISDSAIQLAQLKREPANAEAFAAFRNAVRLYREALRGGEVSPEDAFDPNQLVAPPDASAADRVFLDFLYRNRSSPRLMREGFARFANRRAQEGGMFGEEGVAESARASLMPDGLQGSPEAPAEPGSLAKDDLVVVTRKDGGTVEGRYQRETDRRVVITTPDGATTRIPRAEIEGISRRSSRVVESEIDHSDELAPERRAMIDPFQEAIGAVQAAVQGRSVGRGPIRDIPGTSADPVAGTEPISAPEVVQAFADLSGAVERVGRVSRGALGHFDPRSGDVRNRRAWNLTTSAHEHGHALEKFVWNDLHSTPKAVRAKARAELVGLGKALYGETKPVGGYAREGFAEYLRIFLTEGSAAARRAAPEFGRWFDSAWLPKQPAELRSAFDKAQGAAARWKQQGASERILQSIPRSVERRATMRERFAAFRRGLRERLLTSLDPLEKAFSRLSEIAPDVDAGVGFHRIAKALQGTSGGRISEAITGQQHDLSGRVVGPGVQEILAPVAKTPEDFDQFRAVWAALHSLYRRGYDVDKLLMDGVAPDAWKQTLGKRVQSLPVSDRDLIHQVASIPRARLDLIREAADRMHRWQTNWLADLVQMGVLSRKRFLRITEANGWRYYAPMIAHIEHIGTDRYVDFDTGARFGAGGSGSAPVKRVTPAGGSWRRIDPFESAVMNAKRVLEWGSQMATRLALVRHAELADRRKTPGKGSPAEIATRVNEKSEHWSEQTGEVWAKLKKQMEDLIGGESPEIDAVGEMVDELPAIMDFFKPSKRADLPEGVLPILRPNESGGDSVEMWFVNPNVERAISGVDERSASAWTRFLEVVQQATARSQKFGATEVSVDFMVRNLFRDGGDYFFNNPNVPAKEIVGGWLRALGKTIRSEVARGRKDAVGDVAGKASGAPEIDIPRALGGRISEFIGSGNVEEVARRPYQSAASRAWHRAMDYIRASDVVPRAAAARAELRAMGALTPEGEPARPLTFEESVRVLLAYKEATIDFNDAGTLVRRWNRVVPFLNAKVQGLRRAVRAMEENPTAWFMRQATTWALTRLPLLIAQADDRRFRALTPEQRQANIYLQDIGVRIPSGATGAWMQNLLDSVFMLRHTGDWGRFGDDVAQIRKSLAGSPSEWLTPIVREALEQASNSDLYRGSAIVPRAVDERTDIPEWAKTTPSTQRPYDAVARLTGYFGGGIAAPRIKHAADTFTGGLASAVADTGEMAASLFGYRRKREDVRPASERTPIVRVFRAPGGSEPSTSYNVEKFYEDLVEARRGENDPSSPETPDRKRAREALEVGSKILRALTRARSAVKDADTAAKVREAMDRYAVKARSGRLLPWPDERGAVESLLYSWGLDAGQILGGR